MGIAMRRDEKIKFYASLNLFTFPTAGKTFFLTTFSDLARRIPTTAFTGVFTP
jgi:hypothetical protein